MKVQIIEKLGPEPLSMEQAKNYLRVLHDYDDEFIGTVLIPAVRSFFQERLNISLVEQKIRVVVSEAEADFELPFWPVDELITTIPAGLTHTDGVLDNEADDDLDITYTTEAYVKDDIRTGIYNLISHWYTNRDMATVPESVEKIIKLNTKNLWFV